MSTSDKVGSNTFNKFNIFKHKIKSALRRHISKESKFNKRKFRRSEYEKDMPDWPLVKRSWADSSLVIKPILDGDHTGEQYSTSERTDTLKALTSEEGSLDRKHFLFRKARWLVDAVML